jgi:nucleoside-diphosphate-sugar epimerase
MKILLTGGGGFVGLALIARLNAMGMKVTSFSTSDHRPWALRALAISDNFGSVAKKFWPFGEGSNGALFSA